MSEGDSFTGSGVVRHACRHRVTARGVFVLGDSFTRSGAAARGVLVFSLVCLVPVVRAYVAGACVGRRLRGNGGRIGGRDSGIARTPVADAVAVCSEGGCGGMCWPVDRPATHAAAGAAARGALIFCFGGFFHMLWSAHSAPSRRWSDATRIKALCLEGNTRRLYCRRFPPPLPGARGARAGTPRGRSVFRLCGFQSAVSFAPLRCRPFPLSNPRAAPARLPSSICADCARRRSSSRCCA